MTTLCSLYPFKQLQEHVDNGNLFSYVKKKRNLTEREAFKLFSAVCEAIAFMHRHNYIHRDIKPENILLTGENTVKLCDFGWCVEIAMGNRATFCGTYEYMAPELIKEMPYDKSIDIWSLGILLFEMVHGESPFKGKSVNDSNKIFENILENDIPFKPACSKEFRKLIKSMLERDSSNRPKIEEILVSEWFRIFDSRKRSLKKKSTAELMEMVQAKPAKGDNLVNRVLKKMEKKPKRVAQKTPKKVSDMGIKVKSRNKKIRKNSSMGDVLSYSKQIEIDTLTLDTKREDGMFKKRTSARELPVEKEEIDHTLSLLEQASNKRGENTETQDDKGFWTKVGDFFTPFKCGSG